jgi:hypothetical protein
MNQANGQGLIDFYTFTSLAPPGAMICDLFEFIQSKPEAAFLIKEKEARINMFPKGDMHVEIRSKSMRVDNVILIPWMMQFDNNPSLTYEGWFNYHQSGHVQKCFGHLAVQEWIHIFFFSGGVEPAITISVSNPLQIGFRMYLRQLRNMVPWSSADFERAHCMLSHKFLSTLSLWRALKE